MAYIGIDLGTSAVKLILAKATGEIIKTVSKEYELLLPEEGYCDQRPGDWWDQTKHGLKELVSGQTQKIKGISFSGQMHGLVMLDDNDEVIRPAILWNDGRTQSEVDELNAYNDGVIKELTANIALTGFTAPKILWVKKNEPENFKRISKIMLPKDYISYMLSGVFASDVSDISGTVLYDVKNRKYSDEMLDFVGVTKAQLPKVHESYDEVGTIRPELAVELGIDADCKIIIGGGDQAVGAIGTGTVGDGECSISLGTSGVVFVSSNHFSSNPSKGLHAFAHANGRYHVMGVMLSAAGSLKWIMESILNTKEYDAYLSEVDKKSFDQRLFFLPYLVGERTPINDPNARGAYIGLGLGHDRYDLVKATIEGINFALKDNLEVILNSGIEVKSARLTGGGAKSDVWAQMLADQLGIEIRTLVASEGPAFGAAILAMVGCKEYQTVEEATEKLIRVKKVFTPNQKNVVRYQKKYETFKKIYPALTTLN